MNSHILGTVMCFCLKLEVNTMALELPMGFFVVGFNFIALFFSVSTGGGPFILC